MIIFKFDKKTTAIQAVLFYLITTFGSILSIMSIMTLISIINDPGYLFGFVFGIIAVVSISIILSLRILKFRELDTLNKLLLFLGCVLSGVFGIFVGMIPLTIVNIFVHHEKTHEVIHSHLVGEISTCIY